MSSLPFNLLKPRSHWPTQRVTTLLKPAAWAWTWQSYTFTCPQTKCPCQRLLTPVGTHTDSLLFWQSQTLIDPCCISFRLFETDHLTLWLFSMWLSSTLTVCDVFVSVRLFATWWFIQDSVTGGRFALDSGWTFKVTGTGTRLTFSQLMGRSWEGLAPVFRATQQRNRLQQGCKHN